MADLGSAIGGSGAPSVGAARLACPEPVPEFLLDVPIPEDEGGDLYEALADLTAYTRATRDPQEPRFLVHGLVQDVTRRSLDAAARDRGARLGEYRLRRRPRGCAELGPARPARPACSERDPARRCVGITEPTARLMNDLGLFACYEITVRVGGAALSPGAGDQ